MRRKRLYDNAIIIAPSSEKKTLLSYRLEHPDQSFSIYSVEEIESAFSYHHDDRLIIDLIKKGYGFQEANEIADALDSFKKGNYGSKKLQNLAIFFDEYTKNGFLFPLVYPEKTFARKQYVIRGYYAGERISEALSAMPNIGMLWDELPPKKEAFPAIHRFEDVHSEYHYVCNRIAKLLDEGVDPEKIILLGVESSAYYEFQLMARSYGFSIAFPSSLTLAESKLGLTFLTSFANHDLSDALSSLDPYKDHLDYPNLVTLLKTYDIPELTKQRQIGVYEALLASKKTKAKHLKGAVQVSSSRYIERGCHAFLLSFHLGSCPKIHRDDGYLNDAEKKELGLPTTLVLNRRDEADLLSLLKREEIEAVTFAERSGPNDYHPSPLASGKKPLLTYAKDNHLDYEYSKGFSASWLAFLRDQERRYGSKSKYLAPLSKEVKLDYLGYDSSFGTFSDAKNAGSIHLSASSATTFYECPFHYYLDRIVDIHDDEPTFSQAIGNAFHNALEPMNQAGYDPEKEIDRTLSEEGKKYPYSETEKLLLKRLRERFLLAEEFISINERRMESPLFFTEQPLSYWATPNWSIVGRFDKMILTGKNHPFISVVDYKTSDASFQEAALSYGKSLQLPTYALLCKESKEFSQKEILGLFISPILPKVTTREGKLSEEETATKDMRLNGIFLADKDALKTLTPDLFNGDFISGLVVVKGGGFAANNTHAKSKQQFDEYISLARDKYLEAFKRIADGSFPIEPLYVGGKNLACTYCPYGDVCFKTEKMRRDVSKKKD